VRVLLDTQVLLWWLFDDPRLGSDVASRISDEDNDIAVSAVSAFEISIKAVIGKLEAPDDLKDQLGATGFRELPVTIAHGIEVGKLPLHHKDPFDRLIVAQARYEDLTLITADRMLSKYDVRTMPAS
jgi:PIN domain nuclease of toxin-antitoxin system